MAWKTIIEAAAFYAVAEKTIRRRAERGDLASYLDTQCVGAPSRRMVWCRPQPAGEEVLAVLRDLRREVAELRAEVSELRSSGPAPEIRPRRKPSGRSSDTKSTRSTSPAAASKTAPNPSNAPTPFDVGDLLAQVEALRLRGVSGNTVEKDSGLSSGFLSKAKKGKCRTKRSNESWEKLAAYLEEVAF